jgi:NADPH:quinone reductase-like Zn-dependent oxidoreductase
VPFETLNVLKGTFETSAMSGPPEPGDPQGRARRGPRRARALIGSGAFRPVVDRRYPLDDIVAAYRYVESGREGGNVVIDV